MPNVGDYNQGVSTGSVTFSGGAAVVSVIADPVFHPIDTQPMVQITPVGVNADYCTFTYETVVVAGKWWIYFRSSINNTEVSLTVNYTIISRIEPKHIQDHTRP